MEKHPGIINGGVARANGTIEPANTFDVLATVIDKFKAHGIPIASRHKGIIGRQVKELLNDGFEPELLVLATFTALRRGEPQNVHFIANDLNMARAGQRMTRREYETALQDEMELGGLR